MKTPEGIAANTWAIFVDMVTGLGNPLRKD